MTASEHIPSVTVIIPVRNGELYLEDAIRSAFNQALPNLQILVSDNGSSDGTASIIASYAGKQGFSAIRQTQSLSMLEHFNKCLDLVHTDYYMLLCHDDFLLGDSALSNALSVMQKNPEISAVYCDLDYVDRRGQKISERKFLRSGIMNAENLGRRSVISMRNHFGIPLLIKTSALGSRRYVTSLPYVADIELSLSLASQGPAYHIQKQLIANRYHASNSTRGLHGESLRQMSTMAGLHSIALSSWDKLMMSINAKLMFLAKMAFFQYLGLRDLLLKR